LLSGGPCARATTRLSLLDNLCLAVIGIAAGSELHLSELRKNPKPVLVMTASITVFTWVFIFAVFSAVGSQVEFLKDLTQAHVFAIASLAATLGVARSPASAIAVLRETEGRGQFCTLVMSVTVVKDVLVVVMFAMNLELVALSGLDFVGKGGAEIGGDGAADQPVAGAGGGGMATLLALLEPIFSVVMTFAVGIGAGVLVGQLLKPASRPVLGRILRPTWILMLAATLFVGSGLVGLEPLLLCVVAGAVAANRQHANGETEREVLHTVVSAVMPGINLVFFTLAGASLHLSSVFNSASFAALIVGTRLAALYIAAWVGCHLAGCPAEHKQVAWMGYVTQAGVALGLARTAVTRFPAWGEDFSAIMVAVIVMNQVLGPPLFRAAIIAVGESSSAGRGVKEGGQGALGGGGGGKEEGV